MKTLSKRYTKTLLGIGTLSGYTRAYLYRSTMLKHCFCLEAGCSLVCLATGGGRFLINGFLGHSLNDINDWESY